MKKTYFLSAVILLLGICPSLLSAAPDKALDTAPEGWVVMFDNDFQKYVRLGGNKNNNLFSRNLDNMPASGRTRMEERNRGVVFTGNGVKYTTGMFVGGNEYDYKTIPATIIAEHPGEMSYSLTVGGNYDRFRAVFAVMEPDRPSHTKVPITPAHGKISIEIDGAEKYSKTFNSRSRDELVEIDLSGASNMTLKASGLQLMICEPFFRRSGAASLYPGKADTFIAADPVRAREKLVHGVPVGTYRHAPSNSYVTLHDDVTFTMELKCPQGMIAVSGRWHGVVVLDYVGVQIIAKNYPQGWKSPEYNFFAYKMGELISGAQWGDVPKGAKFILDPATTTAAPPSAPAATSSAPAEEPAASSTAPSVPVSRTEKPAAAPIPAADTGKEESDNAEPDNSAADAFNKFLNQAK